MSQDIFAKTGELVSVNTLRRLFGLVKSTSLPSFSTLHLLAKYCGFSSVEQAMASYEKREEDQGENGSLLAYLVGLFENTAVQEVHDPTYINLVKHTIQFLCQEPHIIDPFQRSIAKTRNGQVFYFEHFINIDQLNHYYGRGIAYYLTHKKTREAQIFGNALQALRFWLSKKDDLFFHHANKVLAYPLDNSIHPFVCGRFYGTKVLKACAEKEDMGAVLREARDFYQTIRPSDAYYRMFPGFELTYSTTLVLAKEWQEALYYISRAMQRRGQAMPSYVDRQYFQSFCLFKAIALAHTGKKREAEKIFAELDVNGFYFFARKVLTIFYLRLGRYLKKVKNCDDQLQHLIEETGFVRLASP